MNKRVLASNLINIAPSKRSARIPETDWRCCTNSEPCDVGGGDCDVDSHCMAGLKCGNNNCKRDFSSSGSDWSTAADCCEDNKNYLIALFKCTFVSTWYSIEANVNW